MPALPNEPLDTGVGFARGLNNHFVRLSHFVQRPCRLFDAVFREIRGGVVGRARQALPDVFPSLPRRQLRWPTRLDA
jgi:hypothetical protein